MTPRAPLAPLLLCLALGSGLGPGCRKSTSPAKSATAPTRSPYRDPSLVSTATVTFARDFGHRTPRPLVATFAMDAKPVSLGQYNAWLAKRPDPALQTGPCKDNRSFALDAACAKRRPACPGGACAVTCVDWCDASAYCQAVGKRLCGRIGGGATTWRSFERSNQSQWYNACVAQSNQRGPAITLGRVWQWEDCCNGEGVTALCRTRTFTRGQPGRHDAAAQRLVHCGAANAYGRHTSWPHVGFRCCTP